MEQTHLEKLDQLAKLASTPILRYPRTVHLEGSRLQPGDSAHDQTPLADLAELTARPGCRVVIEEKFDGANSGLSFSGAGELLLQSRGHYLNLESSNGFGERQFAQFKGWARAQEDALLSVLEDRYVLYGEWMAAKHSVFYDALPSLHLEFDVYDRHTGTFLSTARRRELLKDAPILSVPVLYEGEMPADAKLLWSLVRPSLGRTPQWRDSFEAAVARERLDLAICWKQTDKDDAGEGLYVKLEDDEQVLGRFKLVRHSFVQTILDADSHHAKRPIVPNGMHASIGHFSELFSGQVPLSWEELGLHTIMGLDELREAHQADHKKARRKPR